MKREEFINTYIALRQESFHNDSDIIEGLLEIFSKNELEQYGLTDFVHEYFCDEEGL